MKYLYAFVLLFCLSRTCLTRDVRGSMNMDAFTFPKLIQKFDILLKFDKYIPYGSREEAFKEMCARIGESVGGSDFLIGVVGIQDYGEFLNTDMKDRYNINEKEYPVYKLFMKGNPDNPIEFTGDERSVDAIIDFLKQHLNIQVAKPGCIAQFDELAIKFMSTQNRAEQNEIKETVKDVVSTYDDNELITSGNFYLKVMEKIIEKGPEWIAEESLRISRLLKSQLSPEKLEEFGHKENILESFQSAQKK